MTCVGTLAFPLQPPKHIQRAALAIVLYGKKQKGRGLGFIMENEGIIESSSSSSSTRDKKRRTATSKPGKQATTSASISPDLAKFMDTRRNSEKDSKESSSDSVIGTTTSSSSMEDIPNSFEPFEKSKSARRVKQSVRLVQDEERRKAMESIVRQLEETLESKSKDTVPRILEIIQNLLYSSNGSSLKQLTAGNKRLDYRLAWVGSDDAICSVGTGLHKVPLARLQEVFLSLPGRNRVQFIEVIRVLGPFPNVRNTLNGSGMTKAEGEWKITWDSMIDGTGKELLADKEENTRLVELKVQYCDETMIVANVPGDENPLAENGKNVLLFIRDENMEEKLETLRVAG
jgi:hypothetical protein